MAAGLEVQNLILARTSNIDDVIEKRPTSPVLRRALGVRMDLISPCVDESSFKAAQPNSNSPFHAVQKETSGALSLLASNAKT